MASIFDKKSSHLKKSFLKALFLMKNRVFESSQKRDFFG
ncbi:hypothetical protein X559_1252 [Paenilisteria newyorkensis]|nr:hypothetical protein X559_1252 [Listeria newyorkensis]